MLGAGRGGGGTDTRWPLALERVIENVPTCWGFEFVVAILCTLLDVLARFDAPCRLEMKLGNVFWDCEEERLGDESDSFGDNMLFCHGDG